MEGNRAGVQLGNISKYRDELFGISMILIIFFHFCGPHVGHYSEEVSTSIILTFERRFEMYVGSVGVEIFVFLSGMGLYYSFSKNNDIAEFYKRRYKRILIPYMYVGTVFWTLKDIIINNVEISRFLQDLLFYTFFTEGVKTIWFILFLIVVYAMFPLLYRVIYANDKQSAVAFVILILMACGFPITLHKLNPILYSNVQIALTRIPLFIVGVYFGKIIKNNVVVSRLAVLIFVIAAGTLQYCSNKQGWISYWDRNVASLFGMATILVLVYFLELTDRVKIVGRSKR